MNNVFHKKTRAAARPAHADLRCPHRCTGFTLLEVLAALVLLSMLLAIVLPAWSRIHNSSTSLQRQSEARAVLFALDQDDLDALRRDGSLWIDDWQIRATPLQKVSGRSAKDTHSDQSSVYLRLRINDAEDQELAGSMRLLFVNPAQSTAAAAEATDE